MLDFETAADALVNATDSGVSRISALVRQMAVLARRVEDLKGELKVAENSLREMTEKTLPAAMAECGTKELTTDDGTKVKLTPFVAVSIPKDKAEDAYAWLTSNGHGDLVKNVVSITFGRQENDKALELTGSLLKRGYNTSQKQWVEPMTLKAFAKEQLEAGTELPQDLFGLYVGTTAKIERTKGQ